MQYYPLRTCIPHRCWNVMAVGHRKFIQALQATGKCIDRNKKYASSGQCENKQSITNWNAACVVNCFIQKVRSTFPLAKREQPKGKKDFLLFSLGSGDQTAHRVKKTKNAVRNKCIHTLIRGRYRWLVRLSFIWRTYFFSRQTH